MSGHFGKRRLLQDVRCGVTHHRVPEPALRCSPGRRWHETPHTDPSGTSLGAAGTSWSKQTSINRNVRQQELHLCRGTFPGRNWNELPKHASLWMDGPQRHQAKKKMSHNIPCVVLSESVMDERSWEEQYLLPECL